MIFFVKSSLLGKCSLYKYRSEKNNPSLIKMASRQITITESTTQKRVISGITNDTVIQLERQRVKMFQQAQQQGSENHAEVRKDKARQTRGEASALYTSYYNIEPNNLNK